MKRIKKVPFMLIFVTLCGLTFSTTYGQVCSPPGQLCTGTTDCCRGCCEQHTCVERPFACSPDLVALNGFSSCLNHRCPPDQFCYLREVCPSPCPRMPFCRPIAVNVTSYYTPRNPRNGGQQLTRSESMSLISLLLMMSTAAIVGHSLV